MPSRASNKPNSGDFGTRYLRNGKATKKKIIIQYYLTTKEFLFMQISLCRTINGVSGDDTNFIMATEDNIGGGHHNRPGRGNYLLGRIGTGSTLP